MSFLKSLGKALSVASVAVPSAAPILALAVPKTTPALAATIGTIDLVNTVIQSEISGQAAGLTGEQKRKMAAAYITLLIAQSPLLAGRKVTDEEAYKKHVEVLAGAMADLLNDFEPLHEVPVP